MKKIVLVGNTSWSMIKFRYGLMKALILNGYEVNVIAPKDEHSKEIQKIGCKYHDIHIDNKGSNPLKDLKLIFNLKSIYKEINPDLIIYYTIKPNIYGTVASRLLNIKSIAVVTGLGYTFINKGIVSSIAKFLYKFAFNFSYKVFFINSDDKNEFIDNNLVSEEKVFLIPGEGINVEKFNSIKYLKKDNIVRFLLIARMLTDKGVREYVKAASIIKEKYKNVEFGLLGYLDVANPKAITKEQMKEWENEGNIKFYGSTDDVKPFISKSDCIVLPSYREGISMTLMESSSMAKPLIATNVPGCKDLIDDGVNGYLCEVRNAGDLADKMEMMLNLSDEQRVLMGQRGREKMVREFDESIVIGKYLDAIKDMKYKTNKDKNSTPKDHFANVLITSASGLIQLIPYIGGALNQISFGYIASLQMTRIENYLVDLSDFIKSEAIQQDTLSKMNQYFASDEGIEYLYMNLEKVSKTRNSEKLKLYRNMLINQSKDDDILNLDIAEEYLHILEVLRVESILVLEFISKYKSEVSNRGNINFGSIDANETLENNNYLDKLKNKYSFENDTCEYYHQQLISNGLIVDDGMGRVGTRPLEMFRITKMGGEFLEYVGDSK